MQTSEIAKALDAYNAWRRGDDTEQPDPVALGKLIDDAANRLRAITEDINRLRSLKFPTELRKMWSGSEVQEWLNNNIYTVEKSNAKNN